MRIVLLTAMLLGAAAAAGQLALAQIPLQENDAQVLGILLAVDQNTIQLARLAEAKNIDASVADYAWMLEIEHKRNLSQIRRIARALRIKAAGGDLSARLLRTAGVADIQLLAPLDQDTFSREFVWAMVREYTGVLAWIAGQDARSGQVRRLLEETARRVALRLQAAQKIQEEVLR